MEIDLEDEPRRNPETGSDVAYLRRAILTASRICRVTRNRYLPVESTRDPGEWDTLLTLLASRILWDDGNYLQGYDFLDLPPEVARIRMKQAGIAQGYFTALAPDPTDRELPELRRQLAELCGRQGCPPHAAG